MVGHNWHFAATLVFLAACTLIACHSGATPRVREERVEAVQGAAREPQAPPREERREPLSQQPSAAAAREQVHGVDISSTSRKTPRVSRCARHSAR